MDILTFQTFLNYNRLSLYDNIYLPHKNEKACFEVQFLMFLCISYTSHMHNMKDLSDKGSVGLSR